jgi:hypothetical protein
VILTATWLITGSLLTGWVLTGWVLVVLYGVWLHGLVLTLGCGVMVTALLSPLVLMSRPARSVVQDPVFGC